jgi:hypothetical protein
MRRWTAAWAAGLAVIAVAAAIWVVDARQRGVLVAWSLAGATVWVLVRRGFPDSDERPVRTRPTHKGAFREALRMWPVYAVPVLVGQLGRRTMPGEPSFVVGTAAFFSAMSVGLGVVIVLLPVWDRRGRTQDNS